MFLSKELKECTKAILQMENARALVHGAWGGIGGDNISLQKKDKNESISSMLLSGEVDSWSDTRRSTICAFGGPAGSGIVITPFHFCVYITLYCCCVVQVSEV